MLSNAVAPSVEPIVGQITSLMSRDCISLSVNISGFNLPLTSITWSRQGSSLNGTEDRVIITHTPSQPVTAGPVLSTLQLSTVLPQDSSNYTVTATNDAGSDTVMFTLTVRGMNSTCIYSSISTN